MVLHLSPDAELPRRPHPPQCFQQAQVDEQHHLWDMVEAKSLAAVRRCRCPQLAPAGGKGGKGGCAVSWNCRATAV